MLYEENTGRGLFMLEYLIDDLVIWAYRNELLKDYEKRYVYEYAIQVILYNMMLLVVTFLISVFTNNIQSFIMFMICLLYTSPSPRDTR